MPIHADGYAVVEQDTSETMAGKLRTLATIKRLATS
jgi:hypothetical protein